MSAAAIDARFRSRQGDFVLDVAFEAGGRGVTALFGRSGSGKTTVLRCMAGLARAEDGYLRVGDDVWLDTANGVSVPTHRRPLGYVFQEASLLPHLDVRTNLEFGWKRVPAEERRIGLDDVIDWLGLAPLIDRDPAGLSGGERQRVAIGRALLTSPRLLLMDEPMSALDQRSRGSILPYLERLHGALEIPMIYVTHDMSELARLADHIVWMEEGRVRELGEVRELLPRIDDTGRRVAALVEGTVEEHDTEFGLTAVRCSFGRLWVRRFEDDPGQAVRVKVRARDVSLALESTTTDSILNIFECTIADIRPINEAQVLVDLRCGSGDDADTLVARVTRRSIANLELSIGQRVFAKVKSASLRS